MEKQLNLFSLMVQKKMCLDCPYRGNGPLSSQKINRECEEIKGLASCHRSINDGIRCQGSYLDNRNKIPIVLFLERIGLMDFVEVDDYKNKEVILYNEENKRFLKDIL